MYCFQIDIQNIPLNTCDELNSKTIDHLSRTTEQKHVIRTSTPSQLLDCTSVIEDDYAWLSIATADQVVTFLFQIVFENHFSFQKSISFYLYDTIGQTSQLTSLITLPDQTVPLGLSFNPYVSSNAILIDEQHRVFQLDDDTLTFLHQLPDEKPIEFDVSRQIFLDWDASPFLYTIADNYRSSCCLFDIRVRNESFKELFIIGENHSYLAKTERIRGYQKSIANSYQHVFITDYAVIIVDSRMVNRPVRDKTNESIRSFFVFIFRRFILITNYYEYQNLLHRRIGTISIVC